MTKKSLVTNRYIDKVTTPPIKNAE